MLKLLGLQIGAENAFLPICLHIACLLAEIVASCYCHGWYSWFARDVTKNQTKKLSILLSFYFHEVLQHLNTFI